MRVLEDEVDKDNPALVLLAGNFAHPVPELSTQTSVGLYLSKTLTATFS